MKLLCEPLYRPWDNVAGLVNRSFCDHHSHACYRSLGIGIIFAFILDGSELLFLESFIHHDGGVTMVVSDMIHKKNDSQEKKTLLSRTRTIWDPQGARNSSNIMYRT